MIRMIVFIALQILIWPLPSRWANFLRRTLFAWKLGPGSRIGFSIIDAFEVELSEGASIGHFNIIRNIDKLQLGRNSCIGNLNRVSGCPPKNKYLVKEPRRSDFLVGDESAVTHRHFFDCSHSIHIGRFATIAGTHSQFWTHGIDISICRQCADPIMVKDHSMIGSRVLVLKGVSIGVCSVIGAGSVVTKSVPDYVLCVGSPAKVVKELSCDLGYFLRESGAVE